MSKIFISLVLALGVSGFTYSRLGRHIGYNNAKQVWSVVAAVFIVSFLIIVILLYTLLNKL